MGPDTTKNASEPEVVLRPQKIEVPEPPKPKKGLFLFHYVTMLVSGLIVLTLVSVSVFSLLERWLGDANEVSFLSQYMYSFHIYLLVSLVLAAGLHTWTRWKVSQASAEESDVPAVKVFRAIFLTILALTILGSLGAIVYLLADMALGTANETTKGVWLSLLGSFQVIVWSALLWWYFKQSRTTGQLIYVGAVNALVVIVAILLVIFPILGKRDAVIDARTAGDLEAIVTSISTYASKNNKLPAALSDVKIEDEKVASRLSNYEYEITKSTAPKVEETSPSDYDELLDYYSSRSSNSGLSYKLCATFKTDTTKDEEERGIPFFYVPSDMSRHPAGKHCFDQTAYGGKEYEAGDDARALLNGV